MGLLQQRNQLKPQQLFDVSLKARKDKIIFFGSTAKEAEDAAGAKTF